jgi:ribonuclease-3
MTPNDLTSVSDRLGYTFKDEKLIVEALCHSSYVNEQVGEKISDNERLEYLGDAVLNLVIGHMLMTRYPNLKEGELSRMRANLVNELQLADIAKTIDLGSYILLGKGELQTNGSEKSSILADTFEAVIAAVYLDGGFETAFQFIEKHFEPSIVTLNSRTTNQDFKSRLQEVAQVAFRQMPRYKVIEESGPDHDKRFKVQVTLQDLTSEGDGKSKKLAEQDAAREALETLLKQKRIPADDSESG